MNHILAISSSIFAWNEDKEKIVAAIVRKRAQDNTSATRKSTDGLYISVDHISNASRAHPQAQATSCHSSYPRRNSASSITSTTSKCSSISVSSSSHLGLSASTSLTSSLATRGSRLPLWSTRCRHDLINDDEEPGIRYDHKDNLGPSWAEKVGVWKAQTQDTGISEPVGNINTDALDAGEDGESSNIAISCAYALLEDEDDAPTKWRPTRGRVRTPAPPLMRLLRTQSGGNAEAEDQSYLDLGDDDDEGDVSGSDEEQSEHAVASSVALLPAVPTLDPLALCMSTLPYKPDVAVSGWAADFDVIPHGSTSLLLTTF
ncbi:hypothetical protein OBBRIDRAFT_792829 [Obba rivulosa]|uniref:Uncharacterized protein n=1 Tax=Obba rivulosa TaxID=1052685 RepID=A0A8E2ATX9_9APHY|nr:hypothetical protein OBBRIDRAFT_792829 [Obba rivulosa]